MAFSKVSPPKPATPFYTAASVLTIALGMVIGCSEGARDRLMRFFFEVPDPVVTDGDASTTPPAEAAIDLTSALAATRPTDGWILHPPYEMQQCTECHAADAGMSFDASIDTACRQCHAPFFESTRRPHMEDLDTECRACHHPHRSEESALLRSPQPDLCWECHPASLAETPTHAAAAGRSCTECHEVHYSDRPHMLLRDFVPMQALADPGAPGPVAPGDSQPEPVNMGDPAERPGVEPEDFDDLREAFFAEQARKRGISVAEARTADDALSDEELPFDPDDDELIRAGAELFTRNCIRCHGPSLSGDGWIAFRRQKRVDLLREVRRRGWANFADEKAAEIFAAVSEGRVVIGDPSMPAFENKLTKEQRWQLVIFVRSKQIEADR